MTQTLEFFITFISTTSLIAIILHYDKKCNHSWSNFKKQFSYDCIKAIFPLVRFRYSYLFTRTFFDQRKFDWMSKYMSGSSSDSAW